MDALLSFFSDLILFTGGLVVIVLWFIAITVVGIETYDFIKERANEPEEEK